MRPINEALLDAQLEKLERAATWSPRVISKLESFIRTADDYSLFRINPLQYAAEKGVSEAEAIDLFLHASKLGLFDLEWNLICECCGRLSISLRSLGKLNTHFVCDVCRMENHVQLDDFIHVSFTVAQAIRETAFHHPHTLDAEDYVFRYVLAPGLRREPELGPNVEYFRKYTRLLAFVEPGESISHDIEVTPGFVAGGDVTHGTVIELYGVPAEDGEAPSPVHLTFGLPDMQVSELQTGPASFTIPTAHGDSTFDVPHYAQVRTGVSTWTFENRLAGRACVWVLDLPTDLTSTWMEMPPFLSGKRLLTSQTFRNLYRSELIDAGEGLGIRDITFLFTDLKGSTALYDQLGDLKAYHLVRQHFDALAGVVAKHSGSIVKTIGDSVMAAFSTPVDGMRAALEIFGAIEEFNRGRSEQLILKVGVHSGHSIAVTLNDRLDYFGQTVNIASRVQGVAGAHEVCISRDVYAHDGVSRLLESYTVEPVQVSVKGVSGEMQLYRIAMGVGEGVRA